jgi:hypothetical protein
MAKPNYQHMKKQRDLAKKAKQHDKRLKKLARAEAAVVPSPDPKAAP